MVHSPHDSELGRLLTETDLTHAGLARHVNATGRRLHGLDLRYDSSSVHRWLRGSRPVDPVPDLIAGLLTSRLGRTVRASGLFADGDFLSVGVTASEAVEAAGGLWRRAAERPGLVYPFAPGAGSRAGWEWSFGVPSHRLDNTGP